MHLNLRCHQLKIIIYLYLSIYLSFYINFLVTINQKYIIDTHKKGKWNSNIILKIVIKSQGKRAKEEANKQELQKQPENNEQNGESKKNDTNELNYKREADSQT